MTPRSLDLPPLQLGLQPGGRGEVAPAACFIVGAEAAGWLDELLRLDVAPADLRLLLVPRSRADLSPCGVLAFVPGAVLACPSGSRLQPWRRLGNLFLPADAELTPPLSGVELEELAPFAHALFHPGLGVIGYDAGDALRIEDLLAPPREHAVCFDCAVPGVPAATPLRGIRPAQSIDLEGFFAEAREEIGAFAPDALIPPAPKARPRPLRAALGRFLLWLTARAPTTAARATWIDHLRAWSLLQTPERSGASRDLTSHRRSALAELLALLDSDPERGLRHALPLWGPPARGAAPPGAGLPERDIDFAFGKLTASGPTDDWRVDAATTDRLRASYRALALREQRLGRHRRAAYVFAHLLGDFHAAAAALAAGGHHREAAALYRDQLEQPVEAARCLRRGGLLLEAAELFAAAGEHEAAGDVHTELQARDRAFAAYRHAIASAVEAGDPLHGAHIAEEKLLDPDAALAVLAEGWASSRAGDCGLALFALLGRLGRHAEATRLIDEFASLPSAPRVAAVEVLAQAVGTYPDPAVRARLADATRVLAGGCLPRASGAERGLLLSALRTAAPNDPLLARDTQRASALFGRVPPTGGAPSIVLPAGVVWRDAVATADGFVAFGTSGMSSRLLHVHRWGRDSGRSVPLPEGRTAPALALAASRNEVLLVLRTQPPRAFLLTTGPRTGVRRLPGPIGLRAGTLDARGARWLVSCERNAWTLRAAIGIDEVLDAVDLPFEESEDALVSIVATRGPVFVAVGRRLVQRAVDDSIHTYSLEEPALALHGAPTQRNPWIVVVHASGFALFRLVDEGPVGGVLRPEGVFATSLSAPRIALSREGLIVAATEDEVVAFRWTDLGLTPSARYPGPGRPIVALLPGPDPQTVALLTDDGVVRMQRP